jgi:ABC-2 type transport system ATP-binding protein
VQPFSSGTSTVVGGCGCPPSILGGVLPSDEGVRVGTAIEARGLTRSFGPLRAVDGLDLDVPAGSIYGFLGPNGSGKTTTIRLLLGLLRPTAGNVRLLGQPLARDPALFTRIGALVERPAFYGGLSARDNLRVFAATAGMSASQAGARIPEVLDLVDLAEAAGRTVRGFSTGMRQRLAIGLALLRQPELVILDEPTAGLDPAGVVAVRDLIAGLARDGATVFLSSHVLPEVEQLCDRLAVLHRGRLVAEGATAELLGAGARLLVRFETPAQANRAAALLAGDRWTVEPPTEPEWTEILVAGAEGQGARVSRTLAEAGLYPAELGPRRASLESVFLELTGEADPEIPR